MARICTIEGCTAAHEARGYCKEHYQQWWFHGDPLARVYAKRGSGWISAQGYHFKGNKQEHIRLAEQAIGKPLPRGAVVHHHDGNPLNNTPSNLVICPNQAYHRLLHQRIKALDASGNANFRKCVRCGKYSPPESMKIHANSRGSITYRHKTCRQKRVKKQEI